MSTIELMHVPPCNRGGICNWRNAESLITQGSLRKSCSCRRFRFNPFTPMFVLLAIGGGPVGLVLVFAATPKEMALLYALLVS